ncbi:MFS transporter [Flexivirga endophytica]|uniref:MFS transporter n=2 Tax=Flexivirga endophytica TaxID=1849103 RepID=A0A916T3N3_9MICO|nr:MFS transporter [Flexivirga endophytica]GHB61701.1 MFS transporter [Flexivirga endophytica]
MHSEISEAKSVRGRTVLRTGSGSFWLIASLLALLMFAASAPSPLYPTYAAQWHLSAITVTAVFAVYAVTLLAALLILGALSDHIGRRPVIVGALVAEALAMVLFLGAHGLTALYVARGVQGLATGAATSALSAALLELQPPSRAATASLVNSCAPSFGLALGAMVTSVLVQYGPNPTRLIYWIMLATTVIGLAAVARMPEPGHRSPGAVASLRPTVSVPVSSRRAFLAALPCLIATWSLGGLYLSLGPALAGQLAGSANHLWGGLLIFLLMATGAAAPVAGRGLAASTAMTAGCLTLIGGLAVTALAIGQLWVWLLLVGSAIAGVGFGLSFMGAFRTVTASASPADRAALIASVYTASYLAFSIPAVVAGVLTTHVGLRSTSLGYAGAVALLAGASVAGSAVVHRGRHSLPTPDVPPCPCSVPAAHAS